jgi:hypothetical protein
MGLSTKGLREAIESIEKMVEKAAKLSSASDKSENSEEFRAQAGLRKRPRQTKLYAKKEDAELAAKSEEDRAAMEEQADLEDDIGDFLMED